MSVRALGPRPIAWVLVALLVAGCNLMVSDYSTTDDPDGGDLEPERHCTPTAANGSWSQLAGPTAACGEEFCDLWTDLCFSADHHYVVVEKNASLIRWYDSCSVRAPDSLDGRLHCYSGDGAQVILRNDGSHIGGSDFENTWTLYHRDVSPHLSDGPVEGCGEKKCQVFDGFDLDADHRYYLRIDNDRTIEWLQGCMVDREDADEFIRIRCWGASGTSPVSVYIDAVDQNPEPFHGEWSLYVEPRLGGGASTYLESMPGCGTDECPLWDSFAIDPVSSYALVSEGDANVRWFRGCGADLTQAPNLKLFCYLGNRTSITLQTAGAEQLDQDQVAEETYAVIRWPLAAQ